MASTTDKIKHALHMDKNTSTTHTTGTTGTTHTTGHHGTAEGVAGTHNSRVANAADPRLDSDLDGSRTVGGNTTGTGVHSGTHHTGTHQTGTHGTTAGYSGTGTGLQGQTGSTTTPHSSGIANKLDPRVNTTTTGTTGTGYSSGTHAGNHSGSHHTGTTGGISHSTNAGPHNSNLANKADPRVDSDLDGRGNRHGASTTTGGVLGVSGSHATPGSGTAQNTAGPHNSDMLNKLDPRVDADLDGSKTVGGNKTYT